MRPLTYARLLRLLLLPLILMLLTPVAGAAQSPPPAGITKGPLSPGTHLFIRMADNIRTVAEAVTFDVVFYDKGIGVTTLQKPTCTLNVSVVDCIYTLSPSVLDALNIVGAHQLTASISRSDVGEGPQNTDGPFSLMSPAGAPKMVRPIP